jgi:hypothetical protein
MQREVIDNRVFLNSNPTWLSQRLLAIRLKIGLPVIEGPIAVESLKDEQIRRSVSAYFFMILHQKMPKEVVHFGVQHVDNYKLLNLISTQKKDEFEIDFEYGYSSGSVTIPGYDTLNDFFASRSYKLAKVDVVHPIAGSGMSKILPIYGDGGLDPVVTFKIPTMKMESDFDRVRVPCDEEMDLSETLTVVGTGRVGTLIEVCVPAIDSVIDMGAQDFSDVEIMGRQTCSKGVDIGVSDDYGPEMVMGYLTSREYSITITYRLKARRVSKFVSCVTFSDDPILYKCFRSYCVKMKKRVRDFFSDIVRDLKRMKPTRLVLHNITALENYRIPMSMPGGSLINQSLHLVGRKAECSDWYRWFDEDWEVKLVEEDWSPVFHSLAANGSYLATVQQIVGEDKWYQRRSIVSPFYSNVFEDWDDGKSRNTHRFETYEQYLRNKEFGTSEFTLTIDQRYYYGHVAGRAESGHYMSGTVEIACYGDDIVVEV